VARAHLFFAIALVVHASTGYGASLAVPTCLKLVDMRITVEEMDTAFSKPMLDWTDGEFETVRQALNLCAPAMKVFNGYNPEFYDYAVDDALTSLRAKLRVPLLKREFQTVVEPLISEVEELRAIAETGNLTTDDVRRISELRGDLMRRYSEFNEVILDYAFPNMADDLVDIDERAKSVRATEEAAAAKRAEEQERQRLAAEQTVREEEEKARLEAAAAAQKIRDEEERAHAAAAAEAALTPEQRQARDERVQAEAEATEVRESEERRLAAAEVAQRRQAEEAEAAGREQEMQFQREQELQTDSVFIASGMYYFYLIAGECAESSTSWTLASYAQLKDYLATLLARTDESAKKEAWDTANLVFEQNRGNLTAYTCAYVASYYQGLGFRPRIDAGDAPF
jgi:hypothetical protein